MEPKIEELLMYFEQAVIDVQNSDSDYVWNRTSTYFKAVERKNKLAEDIIARCK